MFECCFCLSDFDEGKKLFCGHTCCKCCPSIMYAFNVYDLFASGVPMEEARKRANKDIVCEICGRVTPFDKLLVVGDDPALSCLPKKKPKITDETMSSSPDSLEGEMMEDGLQDEELFPLVKHLKDTVESKRKEFVYGSDKLDQLVDIVETEYKRAEEELKRERDELLEKIRSQREVACVTDEHRNEAYGMLSGTVSVVQAMATNMLQKRRADNGVPKIWECVRKVEALTQRLNAMEPGLKLVKHDNAKKEPLLTLEGSD